MGKTFQHRYLENQNIIQTLKKKEKSFLFSITELIFNGPRFDKPCNSKYKQQKNTVSKLIHLNYLSLL